MSDEEGSRERKNREEEDDEVVVVAVAVVGETAEQRQRGKRENKRQVRTLR